MVNKIDAKYFPCYNETNGGRLPAFAIKGGVIMRCPTCGASFFGSEKTTCPSCGAEVLWKAPVVKQGQSEEFTWDVTDKTATKRAQQLALGPVGNLLRLRYIGFLLTLLSLGLSGLLLAGIGDFFVNDEFGSAELDSYLQGINTMSKAIALTSVLFLAAVMVQIFKLREIEPEMGRAVVWGVLYTAFTVLNIYFEGSLVDLGLLVVSIGFCKCYTEGMCALCLPTCREACNSWIFYWKFYVGMIIASFLVSFSYMMYFVYDMRLIPRQTEVSAVYVLLGVLALVTLAELIVEIRALRITRRSFEQQR